MPYPLDYYERYLDITVPNPDGGADLAVGIRTSNYLLGLHETQIDERVRLLKKVERDFQVGREADPDFTISVRVHTPGGYDVKEFSTIKRTEDDPFWTLIRYPFAGKGSPEGIQAVLQLAATDGAGTSALVSPGDLQKYCDDFLGLDCNGFVGNYLRHEVQGTSWWDSALSGDSISPNHLISDIWEKAAGVERESAAEISSDDTNLMVLVNDSGNIIPGGSPPHGHITLTQPGEYTSSEWHKPNLSVAPGTIVPAVCVVESTAARKADGTNGLARSWYHYADHPTLHHKGVILVDRGLNGGTMKVKVKALQ